MVLKSILLLSLMVQGAIRVVGANPVPDEDVEPFTAAELRAKLPEIREMIAQGLVRLERSSKLIDAMPDAVKLHLAERSIKNNEEQWQKFLALPQPVQERIIVQFLARFPEAAGVVRGNSHLVRRLGFNYNVRSLLARSEVLSRTLRKEMERMDRRMEY